MTDNEITKALECCVNGEDCLNCPLQEQFADCKPMTGALDLINRQKAEIERLEDLNKCYYTSCQQIAKSNHEIKAEAVKEFAELLKEHIRDYHPYYYVIDEEVVDNLVEEMVGENNAPCN